MIDPLYYNQAKECHPWLYLQEALQNYTKDGANSKDLDEAMEDESSDMVNAEYVWMILSFLSFKQ